MLLNFSDRTRTGVFNMIWPHALEVAVKVARPLAEQGPSPKPKIGGSSPPVGKLFSVAGAHGHWQKDACSTVYSQAVTHPNTNTAQCCLTSVIGRELVCST